MAQGAEEGVFHASEGAIVANVLRLYEQPIGAIMTPRNEIHYVDLADPLEEVHRNLSEIPHALVPVCRGGLDENVLGVLEVVDLLPLLMAGRELGAEELEAALHSALFVPESLTTTQLLESFRPSRVNLALIVDEYGSLEGLVTLSDVLVSIVGGPVGSETEEEREIIQREDDSWLVDGGLSLERLRAEIGQEEPLPGEQDKAFHTLGGASSCMSSGVFPRQPSPSRREACASRWWTWTASASTRYWCSGCPSHPPGRKPPIGSPEPPLPGGAPSQGLNGGNATDRDAFSSAGSLQAAAIQIKG